MKIIKTIANTIKNIISDIKRYDVLGESFSRTILNALSASIKLIMSPMPTLSERLNVKIAIKSKIHNGKNIDKELR